MRGDSLIISAMHLTRFLLLCGSCGHDVHSGCGAWWVECLCEYSSSAGEQRRSITELLLPGTRGCCLVSCPVLLPFASVKGMIRWKVHLPLWRRYEKGMDCKYFGWKIKGGPQNILNRMEQWIDPGQNFTMHVNEPPGELGKMQFVTQQVCISSRLLDDALAVGLQAPFLAGRL